jgi:hypothetical protein
MYRNLRTLAIEQPMETPQPSYRARCGNHAFPHPVYSETGYVLRHVFVSFGICLEAHLGHFAYGFLYVICLRNIMSDMAHV